MNYDEKPQTNKYKSMWTILWLTYYPTATSGIPYVDEGREVTVFQLPPNFYRQIVFLRFLRHCLSTGNGALVRSMLTLCSQQQHNSREITTLQTPATSF